MDKDTLIKNEQNEINIQEKLGHMDAPRINAESLINNDVVSTVTETKMDTDTMIENKPSEVNIQEKFGQADELGFSAESLDANGVVGTGKEIKVYTDALIGNRQNDLNIKEKIEHVVESEISTESLVNNGIVTNSVKEIEDLANDTGLGVDKEAISDTEIADDAEKPSEVYKDNQVIKSPSTVLAPGDRDDFFKVGTKSPRLHLSEIEDERNIRVQSAENIPGLSLSTVQEDNQFKRQELDFFYSPVNTKTDMVNINGMPNKGNTETIECEQKETDIKVIQSDVTYSGLEENTQNDLASPPDTKHCINDNSVMSRTIPVSDAQTEKHEAVDSSLGFPAHSTNETKDFAFNMATGDTETNLDQEISERQKKYRDYIIHQENPDKVNSEENDPNSSSLNIANSTVDLATHENMASTTQDQISYPDDNVDEDIGSRKDISEDNKEFPEIDNMDTEVTALSKTLDESSLGVIYVNGEGQDNHNEPENNVPPFKDSVNNDNYIRTEGVKCIEESNISHYNKAESHLSSYSNDTNDYLDDFEETHVTELVTLQPQSPVYRNETLPQNCEQANRSTDDRSFAKPSDGIKELLIDEISSTDIFDLNKTKSPMIRKHTSTSKTDNNYFKKSLRAEDIEDKATKAICHTTQNNESQNDLPKFGDRYPSSREANLTNTKSGVDVFVNPYFTGGLPALGEMDDDKDNPESINKGVEIGNKVVNGVRQQDTNTSREDPLRQSEVVKEADNTSTSRIIEIIREINAPAQKFQITKERPLTPKTPSEKRVNQNNGITNSKIDALLDSPTIGKENNNKDYLAYENSEMKIGDINYVTSSMMNKYAKEEASSLAKFESFPHIQEISEYNKVNKLSEVKSVPMSQSPVQNETRSMELPDFQSQSARQQHHLSEKFDNLDTQTHQTTTVVGSHHKVTRMSDVIKTMEQNKRSTSENDLKAVVASAKLVYGHEITPSSSLLPPLSREATIESGPDAQMSKPDTNESNSTFRTTRVSDDSSHVLICSNCLHQDSNIGSAGFCRECQQYLCGNCISLHKTSRNTRHHEIMIAYCVNELQAKRYVKATGYCVDCQHFLCMKCVIQHTGYRVNRYHRIIQSSFLSKPNKKRNRNPKEEIQPSMPSMNGYKAIDRSDRDQTKSNTKKKILSDLDNNNRYRLPHIPVSDSLYPGPDKKLGISYADKPKWPQASVPKLPYLVQPKSLQAIQTPHAAHQKSAFSTHPKTAFDPAKVKIRILQARYAPGENSKRTQKRKEEGVFTARREKVSDAVSLPDIHSKPAQVPTEKDPKQVPRQSGLKKAKFLKDYCVSVPFPSGERQADIQAMACLPNGQILIADKENNNVKLYTKQFKFKAMVRFNNRLSDICSSNLCPTDLYVATQKHVFEITTMRKGLEVQKKIKVDINRIEGLTCWKYGIAVIYKKTNLTWEVKLMDYRGNSKSKLEIVNPFTQEIDNIPFCYVTTIKGGKRIILSDTKNACMICTDVTSRCVLYETTLSDGSPPSYVTSDDQHNVYVSCMDKIQQLSKDGSNVGAVLIKPDHVKSFGCIVFDSTKELLYVQTARDFVSVYKLS